MPTRKANARWEGGLKGNGTMKLDSGAFEGKYSFSSRFESGEAGTNPEELIGAAHAGCFSMALSLALNNAGYEPEYVETEAQVTVEKQGDGFAITGSKLVTRASVPGIDEEEFLKHAEGAKKGCPVSKALASIDITMDAQLVQ